jgi:hypothetical protein
MYGGCMTDEQKLAMETVAKRLRELNDLDMLEQYLSNNVNEFTMNDKIYRVRKPNSLEKEVANKERMKKYFTMLKDADYMFRKDLEKLYKTKNVDLTAMDRETKNLFVSEQNLLKRLGVSSDPSDIKLLEEEIETLRSQQQEIFVEKEELLKYCIEKQLDDFLKMFLIYLVLEVKEGDKWEKVYKSFDEFMTSTDELLQGKAAQVFAVMIFHENV